MAVKSHGSTLQCDKDQDLPCLALSLLVQLRYVKSVHDCTFYLKTSQFVSQFVTASFTCYFRWGVAIR